MNDSFTQEVVLFDQKNNVDGEFWGPSTSDNSLIQNYGNDAKFGESPFDVQYSDGDIITFDLNFVSNCIQLISINDNKINRIWFDQIDTNRVDYRFAFSCCKDGTSISIVHCAVLADEATLKQKKIDSIGDIVSLLFKSNKLPIDDGDDDSKDTKDNKNNNELLELMEQELQKLQSQDFTKSIETNNDTDKETEKEKEIFNYGLQCWNIAIGFAKMAHELNDMCYQHHRQNISTFTTNNNGNTDCNSNDGKRNEIETKMIDPDENKSCEPSDSITTNNKCNVNSDNYVQMLKMDNLSVLHDFLPRILPTTLTLDATSARSEQLEEESGPTQVTTVLADVGTIDEWSEMALQENPMNFTDVDGKDYSERYQMSLNMEKAQSLQMKQISNDTRKVFNEKLIIGSKMVKYATVVATREAEQESNVEKLRPLEKELQNIENNIVNNLQTYYKTLGNYNNIAAKQQRLLTMNATLKAKMKRNEEMLNKWQCLLSKYGQFNSVAANGIKNLKNQRIEYVNNLEKKWFEWSHGEMIFWFKVKLKWFEKHASIDENTKKVLEDQDGRDAGDNCNSIDFDQILKNLEKQKMRGKFLSLLDKQDLLSLGFESFEDRYNIYQSLQKLATKYPIPKETWVEKDQINEKDENKDTKSLEEKKCVCPITNECIKEPVVAYDGHTYERKAIIEYITKHGHTPKSTEKTDVQMAINMLFDDIR